MGRKGIPNKIICIPGSRGVRDRVMDTAPRVPRSGESPDPSASSGQALGHPDWALRGKVSNRMHLKRAVVISGRTVRSRSFWIVIALLVGSLVAAAQTPELSKTVQQFVRVQGPRIVLTHVRVIDGTSAPAVEDQNIVIEGGKIAAIQLGADIAPTGGEKVLNLRGYTVMPGIVGMHNHLFYIERPNLDANRHSDQP